MNEEEKKAVEFLKTQSNHWKDYMRKKEEKTMEDIIINLIEKQQKEIENKDRQIDLMAEWIEEYTCEKACENSTKKCWEQYFKNKPEKN